MNIGEHWLFIISLAYCTILIIAWAYFWAITELTRDKAVRDADVIAAKARLAAVERRKQLYANWGIRP